MKSQLHKDRKKAVTNIHRILSAPLRGHLSSLGQPIWRTLATFRVLNSVFSVCSYILVLRLIQLTRILLTHRISRPRSLWRVILRRPEEASMTECRSRGWCRRRRWAGWEGRAGPQPEPCKTPGRTPRCWSAGCCRCQCLNAWHACCKSGPGARRCQDGFSRQAWPEKHE